MAIHDLPFLPVEPLDEANIDSDPVRLLQITDCHLGEQAGEKLVGMNTDESLGHVIDLILNEQFCDTSITPSAIVATGDLSNHGSLNAYRRLQEKLARIPTPSIWLPGNHDDIAKMHDVAAASQLRRSVSLGNWYLFLLDSTVPKQVGGMLGDDELRNLALAFSTLPHDAHIAIAVHHPPVEVGCHWLDEQRIADSEKLFALMRTERRVKAVFSGHVHQDFETQVSGLDDVRFFSTPSTCVQFEPRSKGFALDKLMPGYRWIDIYADGRMKTGVSRLKNVVLNLDLASSGY